MRKLLVISRSIDQQRAVYWRWAGFLAPTLIRRTKVESCTSVDTKPFSASIANMMLVAGVLLFFQYM
ncbi:MAG: hypothetical protein R2739_08980 [Chitinophagales bacterium]